MKLLALIPARAGSRGLKNKNILPLEGTPLLVRAIELARASMRRSDDATIMVSTESRHYARMARDAGAEVPFERPKRLATSSARIVDVVLHTLHRLEQDGRTFDAVLLLSAVTPLTRPTDVRKALRAFAAGGEAVASVVHEPQPEAWRFALRDGRLQSDRRGRIGRRQEAERPYRLNGAIFVGSPDWLRRHGQFVVPGRTVALQMPRERSVDIEDRVDLALAQVLWRDQNRPEKRAWV